MLNLSYHTLQAVADKALIDAAAHPRWVVAIGRALVELDSNPFVERQSSGHGLIIGSPSGKCYAANGTCSCTAYQYGQPCWHRAAARLVRLHDEARDRLERDVDEQRMRDDLAEQPRAWEDTPAALPLGERLAFARKQMDELFA
jgi:hypothetical protein